MEANLQLKFSIKSTISWTRYLTILCFGLAGSVDCGSDTAVVLVGLDENKPANHPPSLLPVFDAPLQHTAQIFYFIRRHVE